jgi:hypothetical protein
MQILIASDAPPVTAALRRHLHECGIQCPITHVVPLERAAETIVEIGQALRLVILAAPDNFDTALDMVRRVRAATRSKVVVAGPAQSANILATLHAGADHYLDVESSLADQVRLVVGRLRDEWLEIDEGGTLVTVTSASGGAGRTIAAINISALMAQRTSGCGLLELTSGFGELEDHLGLEARYRLADLLRNGDAIDD